MAPMTRPQLWLHSSLPPMGTLSAGLSPPTTAAKTRSVRDGSVSRPMAAVLRRCFHRPWFAAICHAFSLCGGYYCNERPKPPSKVELLRGRALPSPLPPVSVSSAGTRPARGSERWRCAGSVEMSELRFDDAGDGDHCPLQTHQDRAGFELLHHDHIPGPLLH